MSSEDANEFRCSKCGRFVACVTGPAGYDDYRRAACKNCPTTREGQP